MLAAANAYIASIIGDLPLQPAVYALMFICMVVWLILHIKDAICLVLTIITYATAIAVCCLSYVMLQNSFTRNELIQRYGGVIFNTMMNNWGRNSTEEST